MNNKPPCKDCKSRNSTCHIEGNCILYTKWKKIHEAKRKEISKLSNIDGMYNSFRIYCRDAALRKSSDRGYYY